MIETKRLLLRPGNMNDVDDVLEFRNTDFVLKYNCLNIADKDDVLKEISNSLVLYEKELNKVIGIISIHQDDLRYGVKSMCISYYMNEIYTRKHYMYEALSVLVKQLFNVGCDVVSARVFAPNHASRGLLNKLGFHHEGTLKYAVKGYGNIIYDDCLFSKMKEDKCKN